MKNLLIFSLVLAFVSSCDKVEFPVPPQADGPSESCDTVFNFTQLQSTKVILVEEFTGHYCTNCPQGAYYLDQIKTSHGNNVVVVAIHPSIGPLTDPQTGNSNGSYATEWRIEEGQKLFTSYAMPGFVPVGMLSRTDDGSGNLYHYHPTWITKVNALVGQPANVSVQNKGKFLSTENIVCGQIQVDILNDVTGDLYLTTYLVEDSIVDWQKIAAGTLPSGSVHPDYPPGDNQNYVHKHVLRDVQGHVGIREGVSGGSGSILGTSLGNRTFTAGEQFQFVISFNNLENHWKKNKLYLVSFVHNQITKEILQVSEVHVD